MENDNDTAPPLTTGTVKDIPIPALGTPEPTGTIPPLSGPISDGDETPRARRRKRLNAAQEPAPSTEPAPDVQPIDSEVARMALANGLTKLAKVIFGIVAVARKADYWSLNDEDAKAIGDSGADALAPYMASSAKYLPLAVFGMNVAGVLMPRLQEDAKRAQASEENKQ